MNVDSFFLQPFKMHRKKLVPALRMPAKMRFPKASEWAAAPRASRSSTSLLMTKPARWARSRHAAASCRRSNPRDGGEMVPRKKPAGDTAGGPRVMRLPDDDNGAERSALDPLHPVPKARSQRPDRQFWSAHSRVRTRRWSSSLRSTRPQAPRRLGPDRQGHSAMKKAYLLPQDGHQRSKFRDGFGELKRPKTPSPGRSGGSALSAEAITPPSSTGAVSGMVRLPASRSPARLPSDRQPSAPSASWRL